MTSLSISATGTAYLQSCLAAGVMPGKLPAASDTQSISSAPSADANKASTDAISAATQAKIDAALKMLDSGMPDVAVKPDIDARGRVIDMIA